MFLGVLEKRYAQEDARASRQYTLYSLLWEQADMCDLGDVKSGAEGKGKSWGTIRSKISRFPRSQVKKEDVAVWHAIMRTWERAGPCSRESRQKNRNRPCSVSPEESGRHWRVEHIRQVVHMITMT